MEGFDDDRIKSNQIRSQGQKGRPKKLEFITGFPPRQFPVQCANEEDRKSSRQSRRGLSDD